MKCHHLTVVEIHFWQNQLHKNVSFNRFKIWLEIFQERSALPYDFESNQSSIYNQVELISSMLVKAIMNRARLDKFVCIVKFVAGFCRDQTILSVWLQIWWRGQQRLLCYWKSCTFTQLIWQNDFLDSSNNYQSAQNNVHLHSNVVQVDTTATGCWQTTKFGLAYISSVCTSSLYICFSMHFVIR